MKKINKFIDVVKKAAKHVKKNAAWYILGAATTYISYHFIKMVSDKGVKDGEPYYKNFDDPIEEESEEF